MRAMVREAMFNAISDRVPGARVLDIFSGSGLLGLEALSRGALHCTFVERHRPALAALRANLAHCHVPPEAFTLLPVPVDDLPLEQLAPEPVDLVLADPPFPRIDSLPRSLTAPHEPSPWTPGTVLVLHIPSERPPAPDLGEWRLERHKHYGRSTVAIYVRP